MNYNEFNNTYPNELYNQLQPITMTLMIIDIHLQQLLQSNTTTSTIGWTINYNSTVKESLVLCTMAC
jgi:hypothetical protein